MKQYNYIYKITNLINGKIYIGKHSTDDLDDRYMGSGKIIKQAENKYGLDAFKKEIIAFSDNEDSLNFLERFYIKKYKSRDLSIGYNLTDGGERIYGISMTGEKHWNYGKHHSEETKKKMRHKHNTTELSSLSAKKRFSIKENHPSYGKHPSEETRKKLSIANKGRIVSDEAKAKISAANKGRIVSEETRKKLSIANKGRIVSDAAKAKISAANKGKTPWNKGKTNINKL